MGKEPERVLIFLLIYYAHLINSVSRPSSVFHTFSSLFSLIKLTIVQQHIKGLVFMRNETPTETADLALIHLYPQRYQ